MSTATFTDPQGVRVHYRAWPARAEPGAASANTPRAVVQLAHGLGEYAERWAPLAEFLADHGISVYADDHRGHGATGLEQWGGDHSRLGRLGTGGLRATVADLHQFTGVIRDQNPGVPIFFLGQSWGSLMGQMLIAEHSDDFAGVVFSGTAYRQPGSMNAGDLNGHHKHLGTTGYEWLSRDVAVQEAFVADPLTFYADVVKLFGVRDGLRLFGRPGPMPSDVPLLVMIGSEDSLGGPESVHRLADAYRDRSELTDVEVVIYEGARHELFNETNRDEVRADLLAWLDRHLAPPPFAG